MKTIILPGYSLHNREWAFEINDYLEPENKVVVHEWRHWQPDAPSSFSLKDELEVLVEEVGNDKVNIIAKSVGTMVCAKLLCRNTVSVNKIILCGIPSVTQKRLEIFKPVFIKFPSKRLLCIQNEGDPFASFEEVKKFVGNINPKIRIMKKPNSNHEYPYYSDFVRFLK